MKPGRNIVCIHNAARDNGVKCAGTNIILAAAGHNPRGATNCVEKSTSDKGVVAGCDSTRSPADDGKLAVNNVAIPLQWFRNSL